MRLAAPKLDAVGILPAHEHLRALKARCFRCVDLKTGGAWMIPSTGIDRLRPERPGDPAATTGPRSGAT